MGKDLAGRLIALEGVVDHLGAECGQAKAELVAHLKWIKPRMEVLLSDNHSTEAIENNHAQRLEALEAAVASPHTADETAEVGSISAKALKELGLEPAPTHETEYKLTVTTSDVLAEAQRLADCTTEELEDDDAS